MGKEEIIKILSKIKDTVGENNYKLALAITGHRTGKIKDIIMCSKDGELLLEYIENLEQQNKKQKEVIGKAIEYINSNPNVFYDEYLIDIETLKNNEMKDEIVGEIRFISNLLDILKEELE